MCRAVFEDIVALEGFGLDVEIDADEEESEMPPLPKLECETCHWFIHEEEIVHMLECRCVHHLQCLLDAMDSLESCGRCKELLKPEDHLDLKEIFDSITNGEFEAPFDLPTA